MPNDPGGAASSDSGSCAVSGAAETEGAA
jgi:hypothetical protein